MHGTPILGQHWVEIDLGAPMLVTSVVRHMHAVGQDGCSVYEVQEVCVRLCVCVHCMGGCWVGAVWVYRLQRVAACCSVLQRVAMSFSVRLRCRQDT